MKSPRRWRVSLAEQAETDFDDIIGWTTRVFGAARARVYAGVLHSALRDLSAGPSHPLARGFDVERGLGLLHVARKGRPGRHFLLFQSRPEEQHILVLRILHDAMDLPRHVSDDGAP